MNVAKKLIFGFCILASFQNALYGMNDKDLEEQNYNKVYEEYEHLEFLSEVIEEANNLAFNKEFKSATNLLKEEYKQKKEIYEHNKAIIEAAGLDQIPFFQNILQEKTIQGIKMGVLHVTDHKKDSPAKSFFETLKAKAANIPGAVVETILGYKWKEWKDAWQEEKSYPKPANNREKGIIKYVPSTTDEFTQKQLADEKEFEKRIQEMSDRANFPQKVTVIIKKGITSGTPELGDPHQMKINKDGNIKNYTITINPLYPEKFYNIAKKFATFEKGEFNHIRKLAWYKTWYTVAGALGGLSLGATAYAQENQFSKKTLAIGAAGIIGGALFGAISANCVKESIAIEKEHEIARRAAEIYKAQQDIEESILLEAHVVETHEGDGLTVQEIVYEPSPSSQYPRQRIVPAKKLITYCNEITAKFPKKRTRTIPEL